MPFNYWQAWHKNHFCRKTSTVFDHPLGKEILLTSRLNFPCTALGYSSCSVHFFSHHFHSSGSCRKQWEPPSLQANKPSSSAAGCAFQLFHSFCCLPVVALKSLHIRKLWGSKMLTGLEVRPHQCWLQQDNHLFEQLMVLGWMHPGMEFGLWAAKAHTAGSHWACCWPTPPGPSLWGCFPTTPLSVCTNAQPCSVLGAKLSMGLNFMTALQDFRGKPWTPTFFHTFPRNSHTHKWTL